MVGRVLMLLHEVMLFSYFALLYISCLLKACLVGEKSGRKEGDGYGD